MGICMKTTRTIRLGHGAGCKGRENWRANPDRAVRSGDHAVRAAKSVNPVAEILVLGELQIRDLGRIYMGRALPG